MDYAEFDVNAYSSDEEAVRRPKVIRHRPNYFEEYDGYDFFTRFRLSKRTVERLLEEIEPIISHPTRRNDCLSASQELLLTLNFYSNGSFLRCSGDSAGVSKSTASTTVRRVSSAIASLREHYITMPSTDEEISQIRQDFYSIAKFPRCIGAVDCTHIKLQSPGGEQAELFRNRKQFFSLNVQTLADSELKIRNIEARWPGSAHDSHIFRNSMLYVSLEQEIYPGSVILGDSGYPVKPYLITPLQNPRNQSETLFNESQIRTRNVVERSYGVWKRRFPALAMGLRVSLDTAQAVVVATAILHNIACTENEIVPPVTDEEEAAINLANHVDIAHFPDQRNHANTSVRDSLISYFGQL